MKKENIFHYIARMLVENSKTGRNQITFRDNYPAGAVIYCVTTHKAFEVTDYKSKWNAETRHFEHTITYKDFDIKSSLLNEYQQYLAEKYERKGYNSNESVTTKFLHINDKYRQELDCPNWSSVKDETGYAPCPYNTREYEQLEKKDSCAYQLFYNSLGFDSFDDFQIYLEAHPKTFNMRIDRLYRKFLERIENREYAEGYLY